MKRVGSASRANKSPDDVIFPYPGILSDNLAKYQCKANVVHDKSRNPGLFSEAHSIHLAGNLNDAEKLYRAILSSDDKHFNALTSLGSIHLQRGQWEEAARLFELSLKINADQPIALNNLAVALNQMQRPAEALACCDRIIALNRGFAGAYNNRGLALLGLNRHVEALASYDRAIALKPDFADAYINRGLAFVAMNRHVEALASYDRAIALSPRHADAHWNKSHLKLLLGEFEEGWRLYEWRWQQDHRKQFSRNFPRPLWLGQESLHDKTILLHSEQGFGDTIQMCRYAPMVEALGAAVVLEVEPPLVGLISTIKDSISVIPRGNPLPEFDCHCSLMSLPLAFRTTLSTIPATIPYLGVDPHKQGQWRSRLSSRTRPRIGLVCSGRGEHDNDRHRSIPAERLSPLFDLDGEFHCLQKEIRPRDWEFLRTRPQVRTHENLLNDFSDTAALAAELDLIITVDTSVAHLAGALGKRVWVLLPCAPDYRWMTEREDSPWYPTARLFRQPHLEDWTSVIEKVAAELRAHGCA